MQDRQIWMRSIYRTSTAFFLVSVLSACGGNSDPEPNPINLNSQNTPPVINAPELLTLPNSGAPSNVDISIYDDQNYVPQISWTIESSPEDGDLVINTSSNFLEAIISATVDGEYVISILASDGLNSTSHSIKVQVSNLPPPIIGLVIEPEVLTANTDAFANFDNWSHVYSYYSEYNYIWQINDNAPFESSSAYLSQTLFTSGDRISVELLAREGAHEVRTQSPGKTVANAPPLSNYIDIKPLNAGYGDNLSINILGLFDPDGDQITLSYQWYLNNEIIPGQTGEELPAGIAKAEETVKVEVTLFDGIDSAVFTSTELQIIDSPSRLFVESAPLVINYGSPTNFIVKFVDVDGAIVQTELGQAPTGMTYDPSTETATWTPKPAMFTGQGTFYAHFNASDGQSGAVEITVRNKQSSAVLAKSGISIPGSDFALNIGDFDIDGKTEVLSTDSREKIFTLEFDGESITQDWLYPFSVKPGESVLRLWPYGSDLSQILVVTSKGISLIESRSNVPRRILDTSYNIAAAVYQDLDFDGIKDLLIFDPQGVMSKLNTDDWSLSDFGATINPVEWPNDYYSIAVGNVDGDPALEIVVDTGQVVDGANGDLEWTHFSRFGNNITIGDIDGDGDTEIVASDRWDNVTSYDPIAKTSIWTYNINDFCSLRLYNVDADPQDELVAGPCQYGSVEIYDGSSGTMLLQNKIANEGFNSSFRSFTLGDLDNDSVDELIFSTGSGSTAEDNMAVVALATLSDSTPNVVVNVNPSQIYGFKSIGWDTTTTAQHRAVFVLPETEGGDYGQRVGLLSSSGEFLVSDVIAPNWDNVAEGVVVDSNADGISEVVVGAGNVRAGEVHHLTLDDFTKTHLHTDLGGTEPHQRPEIVSMALGIDADGSSKAVIATNETKLQVYDIASMQAEWTSGGLSGGQLKEAIAINGESSFAIVAATSSELTLWEPLDGTYSKANTVNVECSFLQHIKSGTEHEIACMQSAYSSTESKIIVFNLELGKQAELTVDYIITAIKSTPEGELLIGAKEGVESSFYFDGYEHTLRTISRFNGATTWKSPPLLGEINAISFLDPDAGNSKMAISTSSAMYIVE